MTSKHWAIVAAFGAVAVVALVVVMGIDYRRTIVENGELKLELTEWKMAAIPAMRARGWSFDQELTVQSFRPADLFMALNPCVARDGTRIDTKDCRELTGYQMLSRLGVPVKIVLARDR